MLFAIIFVETGLVVWPFLPGDSLIFFVGYLVHQYSLSFPGVLVLLIAAALLGDNVNYHIGAWLGPRLFQYEKSWLFNKNYLLKTQAFYDKYGAKMVVMARFVPSANVRSLRGGVGKMPYRKFLAYSIGGAVGWVTLCLSAGYFFGGFDVVKQNFEMVIVAIVAVSVLPMAVEFVLAWRKNGREKDGGRFFLGHAAGSHIGRCGVIAGGFSLNASNCRRPRP